MNKEQLNITGLKALVIMLGLSSIIYQVVILREFLSIVQGNELSIGIILAIWMLFTGFGAKIGAVSKKITNKISLIITLQFLISLLPILSLMTLRYLWVDIFPTGQMLNIIQIFLCATVILIPYTIISGFLFSLYCSYVGRKDSIGKIYYLDTAGSVAGGILFSLFLIFIMNTAQILLSLALLNFVVLIFFSYLNQRKLIVLLSVILIPVIIFLFTYNLEFKSKSSLFPDQELVEQKDTPFGNVAVTGLSDQVNIYESGILSATNDNVIENEESVHFTLVQHPHPKSILLIGGGWFGITDEIIKYAPEILDYVEQNPYLIEIGKKYHKPLNSKINLINRDASLYLKSSEKKYDVVIINIPPPSTAQLNRYYTYEFFLKLKKHLNSDGIVSLKMPSTLNYISKEAALVQSVIFNTLNRVFNNVIIIPSGANHFIAGDAPLTYKIGEIIDKREIPTKYVNKFYINEFSLIQRADFIINSLDKNAGINYDFKPVAYYNHIAYLLSFFEINELWLLLSIAVIFSLVIIKLKVYDFAMFSVGFAVSLSEIVVIFSFQIIFGFIYQYIGVIIALFMLGMTGGAYFAVRNFKAVNKKLILLYLICIAVYLIILPFIIKGTSHISEYTIPAYLIFTFLILAVSILAGALFSLISFSYQTNVSKAAGNIYSADLYGSALGAILVSTFLIPVIGFNISCFSGAGLILLAIIFVSVKKAVSEDT
ncbi:fused MFS/spermidine synthase [Bacteroidota bacterium]